MLTCYIDSRQRDVGWSSKSSLHGWDINQARQQKKMYDIQTKKVNTLIRPDGTKKGPKRSSPWYFIEASRLRRERRMDFVPEESAIRTYLIEVDKDTMDMLSALGMADLPGVVKVEPAANDAPQFGGGYAGRGGAGGAPKRY